MATTKTRSIGHGESRSSEKLLDIRTERINNKQRMGSTYQQSYAVGWLLLPLLVYICSNKKAAYLRAFSLWCCCCHIAYERQFVWYVCVCLRANYKSVYDFLFTPFEKRWFAFTRLRIYTSTENDCLRPNVLRSFVLYLCKLIRYLCSFSSHSCLIQAEKCWTICLCFFIVVVVVAAIVVLLLYCCSNHF